MRIFEFILGLHNIDKMVIMIMLLSIAITIIYPSDSTNLGTTKFLPHLIIIIISKENSNFFNILLYISSV